MTEDKNKVENTDADYDRGLERGKEGKGVSQPFVDIRSEQQKEAERRGNEAGKAIKASKDEKDEQ
jgi:hypothetical protein